MKVCVDCNKVVTVENVILHIHHRIVEQTFKEMYDEAMTRAKE